LSLQVALPDRHYVPSRQKNEEERVMENSTHTDPEPWVSRINPNLRAPEPDAFPERILTHGVDYAPRTPAERN